MHLLGIVAKKAVLSTVDVLDACLIGIGISHMKIRRDASVTEVRVF